MAKASSLWILLLLLCSLFLLSTTAFATAPTAFLSWSPVSRVEDYSAAPGAGTPLYLRIQNPPVGFQALATEVAWTPSDIFGPCYFVTSDSTIGSGGGYWEWSNQPLVVGDDSTFHYRLHVDSGSPEIVVRMVMGGGDCGQEPASVCLRMVKFVGANGDTIAAEILGGATLFGGTGGCGLALQQVSPAIVGQGESASIELIGGGFDASTEAALVVGGEVRSADSVSIESPGRLNVVFNTTGLRGRAELRVANNGTGATASLQVAITTQAPPSYEPRSLMLWVKPGRLVLPAGMTSAEPLQCMLPSGLSGILASLQAQEVASCSPATLADPDEIARLASPDQLDIYRVQLADTNVVLACQVLNADTASVRLATPNWFLSYTDVVPSDQLMPKSWHLRNIGTFPAPNALAGADSRASKAWDISTGGRSVQVGVLDSGSWPTHPDLVGRFSTVWRSRSTSNPEDQLGHGTAVAGIIAAQGNGGGRAVGVDWNAQVLSFKLSDGDPTISDIIDALDAAKVMRVRFVNMSFAKVSGAEASMMESVIHNGWHENTFYVASSGNDVGGSPSYPADIYPYVVSVGASMWNDKVWNDDDINWQTWWGYVSGLPTSGTNPGNKLRFLAPGGRLVPTTAKGGGYFEVDPLKLWFPGYPLDHTRIDPLTTQGGFGGTSAAAPVVTGAAALLASIASDSLGGEEIAHLLGLTARPTDPVNPHALRPAEGWGVIDIGAALRAVRPGMRIERGVVLGGVLVDSAAGPVVDVFSCPTLPDMRGVPTTGFTVRRTVVFNPGFATRPYVLTRTHGSNGALTIPVQVSGTLRGPVGNWGTPNFVPRWEPSIDTLAAYRDSCVLYTRVWRLLRNGEAFWWPCMPESTRFAFTVAGIPLTALSVESWEGTHRPRFAVFPTPASGLFTVTGTGGDAGEQLIEVLDVQGRVLRKVFVPERSSLDGTGKFTATMDGREFKPGLYFVRWRSSAGAHTQRVVVIP